MGGRRLEKPGGVFAGIRWGFFQAENDADVCRSFAAVEWHYSERHLIHYPPNTRVQRRVYPALAPAVAM
jgi:hypothetical protein